MSFQGSYALKHIGNIRFSTKITLTHFFLEYTVIIFKFTSNPWKFNSNNQLKTL